MLSLPTRRPPPAVLKYFAQQREKEIESGEARKAFRKVRGLACGAGVCAAASTPAPPACMLTLLGLASTCGCFHACRLGAAVQLRPHGPRRQGPRARPGPAGAGGAGGLRPTCHSVGAADATRAAGPGMHVESACVHGCCMHAFQASTFKLQAAACKQPVYPLLCWRRYAKEVEGVREVVANDLDPAGGCL